MRLTTMKSVLPTALAALSAPLFAQNAQISVETQEISSMPPLHAFMMTGGEHVAFAPQQATMQFMAGMGGPAADVKGAPYSAEGITEFTQTLSDGTRITRKNTTKMARDSEGRTRTENGGSIAGPIGVEVPLMIVISDPVAKEIIYLHEREKSASRMPLRGVFTLPAPPAPPAPPAAPASGAAPGNVVFQRAIPMPPPPPGVAGATTATAVAGGIAYNQSFAVSVLGDSKDSVRESLGKQIIAGVSCDATRVTNNIPAGQIGNDREIRVFTETCVSPELKITMLSRTVDPMNGETIFRIASISRAEPAKSLFQVPSGYTVEENNFRNTVPMAYPAVPATPAAPAVRRKQ